MYDIVPGALQHLREADILGKAGVVVAAQGQAYSRTGAVHSTSRQGARLAGTVEVTDAFPKEEAIATDTARAVKLTRSFPVTVEINDTGDWHFTCPCTPTSASPPSIRPCVHAAALLYYWLARPFAFTPILSDGTHTPSSFAPGIAIEAREVRQEDGSALFKPISPPKSGFLPVQPVKTADSLALLALPDLRVIAKEFELAANGLNKQETIEALLSAFRQPEAVRKVMGTLEKTHRQFLATFTLAGGYMSDQDLRGLFERFTLGKPEQYQQAMTTLQRKGLILRASYNSTQQLRASVGGPGSLNPLEVTWHTPQEVNAALPITLPIAPFQVEEQPEPPIVRYAEPYRLLADLLLVARALEGQTTLREEKRAERRGITGSLMRAAAASLINAPQPPSSPDGAMAIPPPAGLLPADLLAGLEHTIGATRFTPAFMRFAYRILRLGEILYTDSEATRATNGPTARLRLLPNAAELLLGPARGEVTFELFSHWLRQATYSELFELTEASLHLRCRTIAPNQPALRQGELEAENREARQWLISLLAQAPLGQWISFPSFARFVFRLYPTFLQRRQRLYPTPHWWIEQDEGRPLHAEQWNDWMRAEGRYLAQLLQDSLHWWGATDIALAPAGQLLAFRLTPLAELLLRDSGNISGHASINNDLALALRHDGGSSETAQRVHAAQVPAPDGPDAMDEHATYDMSGIELSDQYQVLIVSSAGNWPLIDLVERFTRVDGVLDGRLRYQITPVALSDALQRGEDLDSFLELLRCAHDATPGGGPVEEMLRRLEERVASYGRIRLYSGATLLAAADALTLRELAATTTIEQQTIHAIHPTLLVLKKQGAEQLIDELKRRGQAPLMHEEG